QDHRQRDGHKQITESLRPALENITKSAQKDPRTPQVKLERLPQIPHDYPILSNAILRRTTNYP
ncbi:hypothetical protein, partial [Enterobacter intestinihominis]